MATKAPKANTNYFNIVVTEKGKPHFGVYYAEPKVGLEEIKQLDKDGKLVKIRHYDLFDEIKGKLQSVGIYDKETNAGGKYEVLVVSVLNDENVKETIQVSFQSQFAQSFIKCIESVDETKEVSLKVFRIKDEEKSTAKGREIFNDYFCIYQLNESTGKFETIKSKYKFIKGENDENVNPNQLPQFEKIEKKKAGKTVVEWNTDNFDEALRDIVKNCNAHYKMAASAGPVITQTAETKDGQADDNNDLPF